MSTSTEWTAALLVAAALLLNALNVGVRWQPTRQPNRPAPDTPAQRALGIAWAGMVCATVAIIGFVAYPDANLLWFVLIGGAIVSVPVAALAGRSPRAEPAGALPDDEAVNVTHEDEDG